MKKKVLIGTAAGSMLLSANSFAQDQSEAYHDSLADLLVELDQNYPTLVEKLDTLPVEAVEAVCANDQGILDSDSDLRLIVGLAGRIQNTSVGLCVIQDLQSMIGVRELLPPDGKKIQK